MEATDLTELLQQGRYGECREQAESLLLQGGLDPRDTALAYLSLSRSLSAVHAIQEALGQAELAYHYAHSCGDSDLLAEAICHSAHVYHENGLDKQAVARLSEYFCYYGLYTHAKALEGWVLYNLAVSYRFMGRGTKAMEYYQKAYRWLVAEGAEEQDVERCRADLAWQSLKMGEIEVAEEQMRGSDRFLKRFPGEMEARARHWNNLALHGYMTGEHRRAMETAARVVGLRGISPARKAEACLTLHQTARSLGKERVAIGMAVLARVQASVARRPDLEEETTRSLLAMLHGRADLPRLEDLFAELGLVSR